MMNARANDDNSVLPEVRGNANNAKDTISNPQDDNARTTHDRLRIVMQRRIPSYARNAVRAKTQTNPWYSLPIRCRPATSADTSERLVMENASGTFLNALTIARTIFMKPSPTALPLCYFLSSFPSDAFSFTSSTRRLKNYIIDIKLKQILIN